MNVWVLNKKFEKVGIIENYSSLIWSDRYQSAGDIEIVLPVTSIMLKYLIKDNYIYIPDYSVCYIIETILISTDVEMGPSITASGRDLKSLAERRVVWSKSPKPYNNILDGYLQSQVLLLLDYSMGLAAASSRRIPEMYFRFNTSSTVRNVKIDKLSVLGSNVANVLNTICFANNLGYKCELKQSYNMSEFDVVFGSLPRPSGITFTATSSYCYVTGLGSAFQTIGNDIVEGEYKPNTAYRVSAMGNQTTANRTSLSFEYTDGSIEKAFSFQAGTAWTEQTAVSNPAKTLRRVKPTNSGTAVSTSIRLGSVQVVEASLPVQEYAPLTRYGWYFDFQLYKGINRSYAQSSRAYVVFNPNMGNLLRTDYLTSVEAWKNTALVGGEGEGNARKFQQTFRHTVNIFFPGEAESVFFMPWGRSKKDPSKRATRYRLKKVEDTGDINFSGDLVSSKVTGPVTLSFKIISGYNKVSSESLLFQWRVYREGGDGSNPTYTYSAEHMNTRQYIVQDGETQITTMKIYMPSALDKDSYIVLEDIQIERGTVASDYQEPSAGINGYYRREIFVDASGVSSKTDNDGTVSAEVYNNMLKSAGQVELKNHPQLGSFEGEVDGSGVYNYGKDYKLGDVVQIENEFGVQGTTIIEEVVYSEDANGVRLIPTFRGEFGE